MAKALRIAVATIGRFHVLDLARELSSLGHEVTFYAALNARRVEKFGLPKGTLISFFFYILPFLVAERLSKGKIRSKVQYYNNIVLDFLIARRLEDCDIFIGMSGLCVQSAHAARKKFGAKIIIERGSQHILAQAQILSNINAKEQPIAGAINREIMSYNQADFISIPSAHVAKSFQTYGFKSLQLFKNPYGVNIRSFKPKSQQTPRPEKLTAIFVGRWGLRKGADLIEKVVQETNITLHQVGPIDDFTFPNKIGFHRFGSVDQTMLTQFYQKADFLILLSREEGLALVQAQALASGLPILCSQYSGGRDLKGMIEYPQAIIEVDIHQKRSMISGVEKMRDICAELTGQDLLGEKGRKNLSWSSYGERYSDFLIKL